MSYLIEAPTESAELSFRKSEGGKYELVGNRTLEMVRGQDLWLSCQVDGAPEMRINWTVRDERGGCGYHAKTFINEVSRMIGISYFLLS